MSWGDVVVVELGGFGEEGESFEVFNGGIQWGAITPDGEIRA